MVDIDRDRDRVDYLQEIWSGSRCRLLLDTNCAAAAVKTQTIRLLDVFVIGPTMIFVSVARNVHPFFKISLLVFGISTIYYNAKNYLSAK